ncbi:unnamed protein product [Calypogeia fissa]
MREESSNREHMQNRTRRQPGEQLKKETSRPGEQPHNLKRRRAGEQVKKESPTKTREEQLEESRAVIVAKPNVLLEASTGNDDGDDKNRDSRDSNWCSRKTSSYWRTLVAIYAVGSVSLASSLVVLKGIESGSAHAAIGYGIGNGQQPPSRSGGCGGGVGQTMEGLIQTMEGLIQGTVVEKAFGDLIYGPGTEREEEIQRSVSTWRRIPDRLPARALASLSSAAGDLMDGEGPIGGGGAEGGGRLARGVHDAQQIPKDGPYSAPEFRL